jgi:hypothetical protein
LKDFDFSSFAHQVCEPYPEVNSPNTVRPIPSYPKSVYSGDLIKLVIIMVISGRFRWKKKEILHIFEEDVKIITAESRFFIKRPL